MWLNRVKGEWQQRIQSTIMAFGRRGGAHEISCALFLYYVILLVHR